MNGISIDDLRACAASVMQNLDSTCWPIERAISHTAAALCRMYAVDRETAIVAS